MFHRRTVIIVGAGAGADIGMPTGNQLSRTIAEKLNIKIEMDGTVLQGDPLIVREFRRFAKDRMENIEEWIGTGARISSGIEYTRSIDAYINAHKENQKVGICAKLGIVQSILQAERNSAVFVVNSEFANPQKLQASWLPDLMYMLQDEVIVGENLDSIFDNFCIINFNYDRCIEQFLFYALQQLYLIRGERAMELMRQLKIFNPYGVVGYLSWRDGRQVEFGVTDYGDIVGISDELRTFNEQVAEGDVLSRIQDEVGLAERIVFLGFHFHRQNMLLIKTMPPARGGEVCVFATALDRSVADDRIIDGQIRQVLANRGGSWDIAIERTLDCKKLLRDYSTTLMS